MRLAQDNDGLVRGMVTNEASGRDAPISVLAHAGGSWHTEPAPSTGGAVG
jgi:hypothetical protein